MEEPPERATARSYCSSGGPASRQGGPRPLPSPCALQTRHIPTADGVSTPHTEICRLGSIMESQHLPSLSQTAQYNDGNNRELAPVHPYMNRRKYLTCRVSILYGAL